VDVSRTSPRSYCDECAPSRRQERVVSAWQLRGEPFTAEHFRAWSSRLVLPGDVGFVLEDWQEAFVADVFAGFRECWLIVPEGNGKTTLVAVIALYFAEFTEEAWIPVAAAARDQAGLIYRQAEGFVRRTPGLDGSRFRRQPGLRRIVAEGPQSTIQIYASDASTGDGVIPVGLELVDELHRHKTLELYRTWAGKLDKADAQMIVISTAGEPGSEFEEMREAMRQSAVEVERSECFVRAAGESSVLHEYAVPEGGDVEDLELVALANPSARITAETLRAKRARPSWSLSHWQRLTCNVPTRSDESAITEAEWDAARSDEEIPEGEPVWLGLDLGWKYDTTAMVPLWVRDREFRLFGPATILEPPRDGSQLDAHLVERSLLAIHERNPVQTVVMDMTDGAQLSQWIEEELGAEVVDRSQVNSLACLDYARFMEALRMGWLKHTGDRGLRSHALNAVAKMLPQGDVKFERPKASRTVRAELQRRRVIDALVAAAMVHTSAVADLEAATVARSWRAF
jgi:phage terminase large subunit-like protein